MKTIREYGDFKEGLTLLEAKAYLRDRIWEEFQRWTVCQTCPELPNGSIGLFREDVRRFADAILDKTPTYFD